MKYNNYPFFEDSNDSNFIELMIALAKDLNQSNIIFPIKSDELYNVLIENNWVNLNKDNYGSRYFIKKINNFQIKTYYSDWKNTSYSIGILYPFLVMNDDAYCNASKDEVLFQAILDEFYSSFNKLKEGIEEYGYLKYFNYNEIVNKALCGDYEYFHHEYYLIDNIVIGIMQYYDENYYAPAITVNFFSVRDNLKEDLLKWNTNYPLESIR